MSYASKSLTVQELIQALLAIDPTGQYPVRVEGCDLAKVLDFGGHIGLDVDWSQRSRQDFHRIDSRIVWK